MRALTRAEVVALWLWGGEYAAIGLSPIDFYAQLPARRREMVARFLEELDAASDAPGRTE